MNTAIIIILIFCTIAIAWFTWWMSLRGKRYHGISRFFAFESILILVLLNYPVWFKDPFSLHQVISWILLISSIIVALAGIRIFVIEGKPKDQIEDTSRLITTGLYKYIRHPMYLSLMLAGFGILAKDYGYIQLIFALINFIALILTARIEEREMILKFGDDYIKYMISTKMFIPYVF
jgi:protein-S-isoprenylcysteine O-methyltransferase Ste14